MPVLAREYGVAPSEVWGMSPVEVDAFIDDMKRVQREHKQAVERAKRGR